MSEKKADVVLFLLDGCRADALDKAETPNIQKLQSGGVSVERCLTVYPSLTGPGHISMMTGAYPERTGIVGHFYWNKEEKRLYDIFSDEYCEVETIFEVLAKRGLSGINLGGYMRRGSNDSFSKRLMQEAASRISSSPLMGFLDKRPRLYKFFRGFVVGRFSEFEKAFERGDHNFYYLAFLEADKAGHKYGPESDEYHQAIADCDMRVGEVLELSESLERDVTIIITADHGQTTLKERLGLDALVLDEAGYGMDEDYDYSGAHIIFYNKDEEDMAVAAVVSRHVQFWLNRMEDAPKLARVLKGRKGITHVKIEEAMREDRLFHERTGGLSFCLEPGYGFDFLPMAEKGDHGGINRTDMQVPLIIYNESIKPRVLNENRTIDIMPTVLNMLKIDIPNFVQGQCIRWS